MKKALGIAALVLVFSATAYGQNNNKGAAVGSSTSTTTYNGGGSPGYGAGIGGNNGAPLPAYPAAHLGTSWFSGAGDPSFAPSTFVTLEQAIAEGKAAAATPKTLAQVAAENKTTPRAKAKYVFVQDARGNVVPAPQQ